MTCSGQTVNRGRHAGQLVWTWGHFVALGTVVGMTCGHAAHFVFTAEQDVSPLAQAVGVAGQRVLMVGHCVDFGGQIVAFTPPLQAVGFLGHFVGFGGHHVPHRAPGHSVGWMGHMVD